LQQTLFRGNSDGFQTLRILFIADVSIEQPISGAEQVLYQQANGLAGSGMTVWAVNRQDGVASDRVDSICNAVQIVHMPSYSTCLVGFLGAVAGIPGKRLRDVFASQRFDAVVAHQPLALSILRRLTSIRKARFVYIFHSPWHEEYLLNNETRYRATTWLPALLRKQMEGACIRQADKVIVLSAYMKQRLMRVHAVNAKDIVINPGGADTRRFKWAPNRDQLKKQLGWPAGKVHLLTVRNLEPRMGLDRLLDGMVRIKKASPQSYLIIGGKGTERPRLEAMLKRYGLEHDVHLTGFIPQDLLPDYYAAADFFVLPTRRLEGFGLVTAEALSCGTPVLGTPVGGTSEILKALNPDFIFRDNSAQAIAEGILSNVKKYYEDKDVYDTLRRQCRSYALAKYSWERHIRQLVEVLSCLCGANTASFAPARQSEAYGNY
jgi:glycosyltransferase involved in cell wall biosynthesis